MLPLSLTPVDTCGHPKSYQHPMEIMPVRVRPQVSQVSVTEEAPPHTPPPPPPPPSILKDIRCMILVGAATSIIFVVMKVLSRQIYFVATKIILSQQKFCCGKNTFVMTKDVFCHDIHMFVMTKMILVAAPASDSMRC